MTTPAQPAQPVQPAQPARPAEPAQPAASGSSTVDATLAALPSGPAEVLAAIGFGLLMVFLAVVAWDGDVRLPNLSQTVPGLVAALLGAVINPGHTVRRPVWNGLAACALLAACSAGLAVVIYPRHLDAVPALTAAVAAFSGLFVNTSRITHASS
jgi:hypothetical protein